MRAMILAAGRGERMRPLTDSCPKPLLHAGGQSLIAWQLQLLARAGITKVIINHAWLGHMIEDSLGDGSSYGLHIQYSPEDVALETAGGIARALPFFQGRPFLVLNGDVWSDWDPAAACRLLRAWPDGRLAHLVMVANPPHNPGGDFIMLENGLLATKAAGVQTLTYAGMGAYHPDLFMNTRPDVPSPLAPLLYKAMQNGSVSGEYHAGMWVDAGTPERLAGLDAQLQRSRSSDRRNPAS